jgi:hypothetical protein
MKLPRRHRISGFLPVTMIATLLAVTVWSAVGASPASAALFINEKALPKGMTLQQAQAAAIKAKARTSALIAKRDAEAQSKINLAMREVDPLRKAMEQAAKSDPEYGKFLEGAHRIMGDRTSKSQVQALNNHYRNGAKIVERAFKNAGGEGKGYEITLERLFKAVKGLFLTFIGRGSRTREQNATIANEIRFTAPYAVHDTDTEKSGPGFTTVNTSVSNNDAKMELSAEATSVGLFTSCKARATAGVFVDVPAGKRKLKVHIYYNYNYKAGVWAALGIGRASLDGLILLSDVESGDSIDHEQLDFEYSYAVVAWYVESTNDETSFVTLSSDVTPGKRYLVNFLIDATALGIGGGGGGSFVTLTPTAIEVEFLD